MEKSLQQARRNVFKTTGNLLQTVKKHRDILRDLLNKSEKSTGDLSPMSLWFRWAWKLVEKFKHKAILNRDAIIVKLGFEIRCELQIFTSIFLKMCYIYHAPLCRKQKLSVSDIQLWKKDLLRFLSDYLSTVLFLSVR